MRITIEDDKGEKTTYEGVVQFTLGGIMVHPLAGDLPVFRRSVIGDPHLLLGILEMLKLDVESHDGTSSVS